MSDAIRCGECRWWDKVDPDSAHDIAPDQGICEFNPPEWTDSETGWCQPGTREHWGCSHGQRRPVPEAEPTQDDTELLEAKVNFHRRNSSERLDEIGRLNLELSRLRQFASRVQSEAWASPQLYAPFVALLRDLETAEVST